MPAAFDGARLDRLHASTALADRIDEHDAFAGALDAHRRGSARRSAARTARGITRPIQPASRAASTNTTPAGGSLIAHERLLRAQRDRAVAAELHDRQLAAQAGHVAVLPPQRRLEREHEVLAQVEDVVVERRPR